MTWRSWSLPLKTLLYLNNQVKGQRLLLLPERLHDLVSCLPRGAHLVVRDGHCVLEDNPLDGLAAGRRGQGTVVDEVLLRGVGQEALQGEGRHLCALT